MFRLTSLNQLVMEIIDRGHGPALWGVRHDSAGFTHNVGALLSDRPLPTMDELSPGETGKQAEALRGNHPTGLTFRLLPTVTLFERLARAKPHAQRGRSGSMSMASAVDPTLAQVGPMFAIVWVVPTKTENARAAG